jgi:hypothetical protein
VFTISLDPELVSQTLNTKQFTYQWRRKACKKAERPSMVTRIPKVIENHIPNTKTRKMTPTKVEPVQPNAPSNVIW